MRVVIELEKQIKDGRITFDNAKLKDELLGDNVASELQDLVLHLSKLEKIRLSSIIRVKSGHPDGRAVDVGNEEVAKSLLPKVATDEEVKRLRIDQIIFDAKVADSKNERNKWNYNGGRKSDYSDGDLNTHKDHIHFSVLAA